MAANFNALGNYHHLMVNNNIPPSPSFNGNPFALSAPSPSATELPMMRDNPRSISLQWSREEQYMLEALLHRHAEEPVVRRYSLIAMHLEKKSIRDVALRVRWMSHKREHGNFGKRRKDDVMLAQKSEKKMEATSSLVAARTAATVPSHFAARPPVAMSSVFAAPPPAVVPSHVLAQLPATVPSHFATLPNATKLVPGMAAMNIDGGISHGATEASMWEQLDQNAQILSQISRNLASPRVQGNIVNLFYQARQYIIDNINQLNSTGLMSQMPPLPKLDEIPILPQTGSAPLGGRTQFTT